MAWHHAPGLPLAPSCALGRLFQKVLRRAVSKYIATLGLVMWVSIASDAACAAALQHAVQVYGIHDTETLQSVLEYDATGFARALCSALQAEAPSRSSTGTQTDAAILMVETGTQTVADDVVDVSTAEAMVAEALCMVDEAQHCERLADKRARSWEARAELAATLLHAAEVRIERAQAETLAAEKFAAAQHIAMQMLLAAEAALADAAETRAEYECRARWQAEAQRDVWQALAGSRGGRGGRGGRGHAPPPPPPPPPPLPQWISLVLAVHIANEGQMNEDEALAVLNVTERRPKWLLYQVHPDKHPDFIVEATAATARVNQAMDVRFRHVTEV